jgi:hypothetical protein
MLLWCLLKLTSLVLLLTSLYDLGAFSPFGYRALLLIAGVLALQPSSAVVRLGQLSIIVAALCTAALVPYRSQSTSGILTAIAFALKPQLALAFLVRDIVSRRWKACAAAVLTMTVIGLVAVFRMHAPIAWLKCWLFNLNSAFGPTGVNGLGWNNPHSRNAINLEYPLGLFLSNKLVINGSTLVIIGILILPVLGILSSGEISSPALLQSVSLLAVVDLLVMYHREHDAVLLAIPLAWTLSRNVSVLRALPATLAIAVFFFPFLHMLYALDEATPAHPFSTSFYWRVTVWSYQTWALLALAGWLSYCCSHPDETTKKESPRDGLR